MSFHFFERLFVVVLLLSSMGVVDALTRTSSAPLSENRPDLIGAQASVATTIAECAIYTIGLFFVWMRWRRVVWAGRKAGPLLAFVALAPLSIFWSVQPTLSMWRSASLLASTLLAIYLGEQFSIEELARLLAVTLCLLTAATIATYLIAPAYVVDAQSPYGAWKGFTQHKNALGAYMAIAILVLSLVRFRRFRWLRHVFIVTAIVVLLLSHSVTSAILCMLMCVAMLLWRMSRAKRQQRFLALCAAAFTVCLFAYFAYRGSGWFFETVGRTSTFSGRTPVWAAVLSAIAAHPILGYGYGAFWDVLKGETLGVFSGIGFLARDAGNGYLELLLGFGIVGMCIFSYLLICTFRMALGYLRSSKPLALWPIIFLTFFTLHNLSESPIMQAWRSLEFILFAAMTTSLAVHARRDSGRHHDPMWLNEWNTSHGLTPARFDRFPGAVTSR